MPISEGRAYPAEPRVTWLTFPAVFAAGPVGKYQGRHQWKRAKPRQNLRLCLAREGNPGRFG
jgi:hypothetical protein